MAEFHAASRRWVDRILADPPRVHGGSADMEPNQTWHTEAACYYLMADLITPGAVTLETGLGVSTALFAGLGARHTCVVNSADEIDRFRSYAATHGIDLTNVELLNGSSDDVLPGLRLDDLDLLFIDGSHHFPMPIIDWYYGARSLRKGGVVVIDDLLFIGPAMISYFLTRDDRWHVLAETSKWAAYKRMDARGSKEEWRHRKMIRASAEPSLDEDLLHSLIALRRANMLYEASDDQTPREPSSADLHLWLEDCDEPTACGVMRDGLLQTFAASDWGLQQGHAAMLMNHLVTAYGVSVEQSAMADLRAQLRM
ncbi:class I SAM-dependent methyltransferase [Nonomuraea sp. MG754425]|uniref:class I SAM-dependent methyltransferase n=1 Tax=Nonomuraea sp. MG754425 TaxID=2570319 RepID=UPI001F428409|nr:class I SAM-dependent methyltransferase [Nonomuraea sp. MG754425]